MVAAPVAQRLDESLRACGSRLTIRRGPALKALLRLAAESGAGSVYWNRQYEPAAVVRDKAVKAALRERGLAVESFAGNLLFEPWEISNGNGEPYRVFTAFWKACLRARPPERPVGAPERIPKPSLWPETLSVGDLELEPRTDWTGGLRESWVPGEEGAAEQLRRFIAGSVEGYASERDRPDRKGTSRLSPHLRFGEISPRQVWQDCGNEAFLRQLVWREFAQHLLFHFPETASAPLRPEFSRFPWQHDEASLRAWTRGLTGYPLVDAGMRELWHTGWMHNRVRMVAASFLVKHLLISWHEGAAWFWDTLVDADLANNTLGWQWVSGCGADAAPYFRIFNPVLQGEKFDPRGDYVRRWIPELAALPAEWIHQPWASPVRVARYPERIVKHEAARARALAALASLQQNRAPDR